MPQKKKTSKRCAAEGCRAKIDRLSRMMKTCRCRCGRDFCGLHLHDHACKHDHSVQHKAQLALDNPHVDFVKVNRV